MTLTGLFDRDRFQRLIDGVHRSSAALPVASLARRHRPGDDKRWRAALVAGLGREALSDVAQELIAEIQARGLAATRWTSSRSWRSAGSA